MTGASPSRLALRAALLGLAVALPVSADAPTSGPDKQYDDFTASFREIKDRFTLLVWERPPSTAPYPPVLTYAEAEAYCQNGGRRLPTLKELLSLVDEQPHDEYDGTQLVSVMIDPLAFHATPPEAFWTSSPRAAGSLSKATVDFRDGMTREAQLTDRRRVRCVVSLSQ